MSQSILWLDSSEENDRKVIRALVERAVPGPDSHIDKCIEKVMLNIQKTEWQTRYPNRNFVFCVFYKLNIHIIEIAFGLSAQAVDALFYMESGGTGGSFGDKVNFLYKHVYKAKMHKETYEALKVLRNNVMHYGAIFGIKGAVAPADQNLLDAYCEKFRPTNQNMTNEQILFNLAGSFDYMMREMVLRILGLRDEDLTFNANPPGRLGIFMQET